MYLVTLLAGLMFRKPGNPLLPLLLAQAKLASSIFSLVFFFGRAPYLICLANAVVDGLIGALVLSLYFLQKKTRRFMANLTLKLLLAGFTLAGRKKGLQDLFRLTAAAFGREVPALRGQSRGEMLDSYARFTRGQAEQAIAGGAAAGGAQKPL